MLSFWSPGTQKVPSPRARPEYSRQRYADLVHLAHAEEASSSFPKMVYDIIIALVHTVDHRPSLLSTKTLPPSKGKRQNAKM